MMHAEIPENIEMPTTTVVEVPHDDATAPEQLTDAERALDEKYVVETFALCLYNIVSNARRDLTVAQALEFLQQRWEPALTERLLMRGLDYLTARGFMAMVRVPKKHGDGYVEIELLRPTKRLRDGRADPLQRDMRDQVSLIRVNP